MLKRPSKLLNLTPAGGGDGGVITDNESDGHQRMFVRGSGDISRLFCGVKTALTSQRSGRLWPIVATKTGVLSQNM